jgi:hypothetical protein
LIRDSVVPDAVGFLPWMADHNGMLVARPNVLLLVAMAAVAMAGLFFLLRPPRLPAVAPLLLLLYFVSVLATAERWYHLEGSAADTSGPDRAWVDHAIGRHARAVAVFSGVRAPYLIWEAEFFNRSVRTFYYLRQPSWRGFPEQKLVVRRRTGVLVDEAGKPLHARYALVDPWVVLGGRVIARDRASGMRLYRLNAGRAARIAAT